MLKEKLERSISATPTHPSSAASKVEPLHRDLVLRILASRCFARSERLCTLLKYVCDMAFKGREADLNEQRIGQAVFGRSPDYDSSVDGIVRTQASRLRQRLELYFEDEGIEEPIRMIIPKGGYVPVFIPRLAVEKLSFSSTPEVGGSPPNDERSSKPVLTASVAISQITSWILCTVLAISLVVILYRHRMVTAGGDSTPPHPLWSQMFSAQHPTLEVPGDSGLVLFHRFSNQRVSLNDYLLGDYRSATANPSEHGQEGETKAVRTDVANRRYTSIVDLDAAVTLAQIAQSRHSTLQIRYARDLRPNDLKNGNVILLGAFEANPWVELFERKMNFRLENNYSSHIFSVINNSPHTGEPARWESVATDPQRTVYGIVAYAPNLSGNGNALLVEGTAMAGTEAAWDFVSDDTVLLPFLEKIRLANGRVPYFELLLGTQSMGSSAVHSNLIAWRTSN